MFFSRPIVTCTAAALLASVVSGFGVPILQTPLSQRTSSVVMYGIRCENKYYQLEEMEDKESCTTELFLLEDGGIEFGETDGPLWTSAVGGWKIFPGTDNFQMDIVRKFSTGTSGRDMGEFDYEIVRSFVGEMTEVGESVGIAGVMNSVDNQEVGFFSMIDGTEEREDRRSDARIGIQAESPAASNTPQYGQGAPQQPAQSSSPPDWPSYPS